jgi:hypothetical protein
MHIITEAIGWLVAAILWPFQSWPPMVGLAVVSLLVAMALLVAFKLTSNQSAIAAVKRRIQAGLFELRLFQEDPRLMLRVAADLLRAQASYLRYALVPLLWVSLPMALLIAQLHAYYGYDPLLPGQPAVVTARLRVGASGAGDPRLALDAPPGVRVETPCVWVPSLREAAWRVVADREGDYDLRVTVNGHDSGSTHLRVTSRLVIPDPPLPSDSPIDSIDVSYPEAAPLPFALPWLALFFILTTAFALAGRPLLGVVF